jgi:acyl-coenzyme A synthetase/AMP-(fatty) acid ligase
MSALDVDKLAAILQQQGISEGDFVSVFMTNSPEMVITICAISKLGAVPGLINAALRSESTLADFVLPSLTTCDRSNFGPLHENRQCKAHRLHSRSHRICG